MRTADPQVTLRAQSLVREFVALSAASSLIPQPILCTTVLTGVHLQMLIDLSRLYGVAIEPKSARALLVAGVAGAATNGIIHLRGVQRFIAAFAPVVIPIWFIDGSILAGTFSHYLGHAFIRHYESGGDYASFDWPQFRRELAQKLTLRSGQPHTGGATAVPV